MRLKDKVSIVTGSGRGISVFSDVINLQTSCLIICAIGFIGSFGSLLAAKSVVAQN